MSGITATRTAQEVYDHVTRQFGDESGVQITQNDIIRWINSGQDEILRRSKPIKSTATADLIAGQSAYTFPTNILEVQALHVNGRKVEYRSFQEAEEYIIEQDPNNLNTSDAPVVWYEWGGNFMFWPTPSKNLANGIVIYYIPSVSKVTALADVLTIPDSYYNRLVEYVLAQAYEMDENWEGSTRKSTQFESGLQSQNVNDSLQHDVYPTITVLEEDSW
jgi:hypothetical protein